MTKPIDFEKMARNLLTDILQKDPEWGDLYRLEAALRSIAERVEEETMHRFADFMTKEQNSLLFAARLYSSKPEGGGKA